MATNLDKFMIYDHIQNLSFYLPEKNYYSILKFIENIPAENGRFEIDGKNLFALISSYTPRDYEDGNYESHFQYIDLQIMAQGSEEIYYYPICELDLKIEEKDKDIAFYQKIDKGYSFLITSSMFALIYPQDGHLQSVSKNKNQNLRKIVFKIRQICV